MPTGVRSSDIIAKIFGARHAGKMQEAQGQQYVNAQKAAAAKVKQERRDKLFSQGLEIAKAFTPESGAEVMRTGNPFAGQLRPSESDKKRAWEDQKLDQAVAFFSSPEGEKIIADNFPDIDPKQFPTILSKLGTEGMDAINKAAKEQWSRGMDEKQLAVSQGNLDVSRQRLSLDQTKEKTAGAKALPQWMQMMGFNADEESMQRQGEIDNIDADLARLHAYSKGTLIKPEDVEKASQAIAKLTKEKKKLEREQKAHFFELLQSGVAPEDSSQSAQEIYDSIYGQYGTESE